MTEGLYLQVTNMILWHLENMLTLAIMCMHAIIWYYSHLWICSRSDTVYGPSSETVKICLEKVL